MSPQLTYGRHRGPAPPSARTAAVLILLFERHGRWHLPLIVRPDTMAFHRGQISLPGGLIERGETAEAAAVRELTEELGPQRGVRLLGPLAESYVFASDTLVSPWVGIVTVAPHWVPNPSEVCRVIELPLDVLWDEVRIEQMMVRRGGLAFSAPCYAVGQDRIWGATAVILGEFVDVLEQVTPET